MEFSGLKGYHEQIANAKWRLAHVPDVNHLIVSHSFELHRSDFAILFYLYIRGRALRRLPVSGKIRTPTT
jgi:hypothetical protein